MVESRNIEVGKIVVSRGQLYAGRGRYDIAEAYNKFEDGTLVGLCRFCVVLPTEMVTR